MKKIILPLAIFLLSLSSFAQESEQDYLKKEYARIERAKATDQKIDAYIAGKIKSFKLDSRQRKIVTANWEALNAEIRKEKGHTLEEMVDKAKWESLREEYFRLNPSELSNYYAALMPETIACTNGNFEENGGSTAGYSYFRNNSTDPWVAYNNFPTVAVTPGTLNGQIRLVDNSEPDVVAYFPRMSSGSYAIRLNDTEYNKSVSRMTKTFTVSQSLITFNYALVLMYDTAADHQTNPSKQPYFQYRLKNAAGTVLYENHIVSNINNPIFMNAYPNNTTDTTLYTDWTCATINAAPYIGQDVTLEIVVSDCGIGDHFGYAYVDDFCGTSCTAICPSNINIWHNLTTTQTQQAADVITVYGQVVPSNGAQVNCKATQVVFKPGSSIRVVGTGKFRGSVEPCVSNRFAYPHDETDDMASVRERPINDGDGMIRILPNPNNGRFQIGLAQKASGVIEISDLVGAVVYRSDFNNQDDIAINMQDKPKGIYVVRVYTADKVYTEKLIKN